MPLKVRCRCGQELVLRYGEWIHVAIVLLLLAVLANTTAVVVLLLDQRELRSRIEAGAPPRDGANRSGSAETPPEESRAEDAPSGGDEPARSGGPSVGRDARGGPGASEAGTEALRGGSSKVSGIVRLPSSPPAVEDLLEQLELLPQQRPSRNARAAPDTRAPSTPPRPLDDAPRLVRLLAVDEARNDPLLSCGFLLDPDPVLRRAAAQRALEGPAGSPHGLPETTRRECRILVHTARELLAQSRSGSKLLEAYAPGSESPTRETDSEIPPPSLWSRLESRARALIASLPGSAPLAEAARSIERDGADVVLAIDTTRSMDRGLEDLRGTVSWLFPALEWGLPGVRIGVVLYKDEVERAVDLSGQPGRDVLPLLLKVEARGGGDVPEGLLPALRTSLELGSIDWSPRAGKHVIFLGDQPTPYSSKRSFESLARACYRQGGIRVHLLGMHPEGDREEVPFFAEFARAGGGRHASCDRSSLAREALTCVIGDASRPVPRQLAALLEEVFTPAAGRDPPPAVPGNP